MSRPDTPRQAPATASMTLRSADFKLLRRVLLARVDRGEEQLVAASLTTDDLVTIRRARKPRRPGCPCRAVP